MYRRLSSLWMLDSETVVKAQTRQSAVQGQRSRSAAQTPENLVNRLASGWITHVIDSSSGLNQRFDDAQVIRSGLVDR
jgi:hypothetical protein